MNASGHVAPARVAAAVEGLRALRRPLVLGLSGGPDSTALAALVAEAGVPALALHVNHHLRPDACHDEDAARRTANALAIPFRVVHLDGARLRASPRGWEAAARDRRYALFAEAARECGGHVATGHTAGDRLENVLLRLVEGAGIAGLAGPRADIELHGVCVLRPLLSWWRTDIETYLLERELAWVSDPSNADGTRRRARIRHTVARDLLDAASPRALERSLAQIAEDVEVFEVLLDERVAAIARRLDVGAAELDLAALRACPGALRTALLRRIFTRCAIGRPSREFVRAVSDRCVRPAPFQLDGERVWAHALGDVLHLQHVPSGRGSQRDRPAEPPASPPSPSPPPDPPEESAHGAQQGSPQRHPSLQGSAILPDVRPDSLCPGRDALGYPRSGSSDLDEPSDIGDSH